MNKLSILLWTVSVLLTACSQRNGDNEGAEIVTFHLPTALAQEAQVWVFTPQSHFLYATAAKELTTEAGGQSFTALMITGRYSLLIATDAQALLLHAYPQGIPQGTTAKEVLQALDDSPDSPDSPPDPLKGGDYLPSPQIAFMEDVTIAPGLNLSFTIQIKPWNEVVSQQAI
jgi:hypothetical protein